MEQKISRPKYYKDNPEAVTKRNARKNPKRVFVDGKYIGMSHRCGFAPGRYESGDMVTSIFRATRAGYVYIITNPAWPDLCKIGRSHDPYQRQSQANTWCPHSQYEVHAMVYSEDSYALEKSVHTALAKRKRKLVGEWFEINRWHADNLIRMIKKDTQDADICV